MLILKYTSELYIETTLPIFDSHRTSKLHYTTYTSKVYVFAGKFEEGAGKKSRQNLKRYLNVNDARF